MRSRKILLLAVVSILSLPFLVSLSNDCQSNSPNAFSPVVYGGHNVGSSNSGTPGGQGGQGTECFPCAVLGPCFCDPGEIPGSPGPTGEQQADKTGEPTNPEQGDPNPGTLALLAVLALLIWRFGR